MTAHSRLIALISLTLLVSLGGCRQNSPIASSATPYPEATTAVPRTKEFPWMSVSRWYEMHAEDVAVARKDSIELLFIGDSITESWTWGDGRNDVYQNHFGDYQAANFGVGGDMTQNLLWRLQHSLQGELAPRAVVLMIGVNNFLHEQHSPEAVAAGVRAVAAQIQKNYPSAKLLIIGVLPFHQNADNPSRQVITEVNRRLADLQDQKSIFFTNVNPQFLDSNGDIPKELMDDFIHPTAAGLEIIAQNIEPIIRPWIKEHSAGQTHIDAGDDRVQVMGRSAVTAKGHRQIGYPGVTLRFKTNAAVVSMRARSEKGESYMDLQVDDGAPQLIKIPATTTTIELLRTDGDGEHTITLQNRSETWHGITTINSFTLLDGDLLQVPPLPQRKMLFLGDSITCGDAIDRPLNDDADCKKDNSWWNARQTYGMQLGRALDAQVHLVCYSGRGVIRTWQGNTEEDKAVEFFDYAVPSAANPPIWDHSQFMPDLAFIALGTNDFSSHAGPIPSEEVYTEAYRKLINKIRDAHKDIQIIITDGPMLNDDGVKRKTTLQNYLRKVADTEENVTFLAANAYPGDRCDSHPNRDQHRTMARDLLPQIKRIMGWEE